MTRLDLDALSDATTKITWHYGLRIKAPEYLVTLQQDPAAIQAPAPLQASWQVWCDDKLVGGLKMLASTGRSMTVVIEDDDDDVMGMSLIPVTREAKCARFVVQGKQGAIGDWMEENHVPPGTKRTLIPQEDALLFTWKVFNVNLEQYEQLFDHPDFEPQ
ncbi:hypothetical protein NKH72_22425 [Mesorhizobium sp. M0955]|uniref:hypothetical protein n=1 Tax=Mesorhizobium sp. M0955 TaxID=2957033 RepID=UPI003337DC23